MVKIILILAIAHYILNFFFKSEEGVLQCGVWGWAGKNPKRFNKFKFNILGLFNEDRGEDSCGVTVDSKIYYGTNNKKKYRDFSSSDIFPLPEESPIAFGHTRNSSVGSINTTNAHPFGFKNDENGSEDLFDFIGVHNGTLYNTEELCKSFKIEEVVSSLKGSHTTYRTKIDSEVLLEIIFKSENFEVLEKYNGGAALIFTSRKEPNVIYCYHGKSSKYTLNSVSEEERPLFYYRESKHSLYISSMKNSLKAIGGDEGNIKAFDHNIVYKITDGDISTAIKFKINRSKALQKKNYGSNTYGYGGGYPGTYYDRNDDIYDTPYGTANNSNCKLLDNKYNIFNETVEHKPHEVYFEGLRYMKNNTPLNGIYSYIPETGFYLLSSVSYAAAVDAFKFYVGKELVTGIFVHNKSASEVGKNIPFPIDKYKERVPEFYYFVDGIRIKTFDDYNVISKDYAKFDYIQLSFVAAHPVKDNAFTYKSSKLQNVLYDGVKADGSFSVLRSDKVYKFKEGNCVEITDKDQSPTIIVKKSTTNEEKSKALHKKVEEVEAEIIEEDGTEMFESFVYDYLEPIMGDMDAVSAILEEDEDSLPDGLKFIKSKINTFIKEVTPQLPVIID